MSKNAAGSASARLPAPPVVVCACCETRVLVAQPIVVEDETVGELWTETWCPECFYKRVSCRDCAFEVPGHFHGRDVPVNQRCRHVEGANCVHTGVPCSMFAQMRTLRQDEREERIKRTAWIG